MNDSPEELKDSLESCTLPSQLRKTKVDRPEEKGKLHLLWWSDVCALCCCADGEKESGAGGEGRSVNEGMLKMETTGEQE